ncbi:hypothetical protein SAMN05444064_1111, partial [Pseudomonas syringae]
RMPFWTLCVLCVALCVTLRFCKVSDVCLRLKAPFRPSATYFDGAKVGKPPGSVSGPTSSGSFALSLIRGSPQRALHGPVRLARRPASHPPDQRQDSAVTYVALCVVSDIAVKKRFNYRATLRVACRSGRSASSVWRSASHCGSARSVMFVYDSRHLFAPQRPTLMGPK